MSSDSKLLGIIKQAALEAVAHEKPLEILVGTVETAQPLSVRLSQKILLTEAFLTLSRTVTDYQTELSFDDGAIKQIYTTWDMAENQESEKNKICFKVPVRHKVTIYNGLKAGERVLLLRMQKSSRYIIIDRVGTE